MRSGRWLLLIAAAVVLAIVLIWSSFPADLSSQPASSRRLVLVSIDGGADWIVDEMMARGKAPVFSAMAREGAHADAMVSVLPTLTAPAHVTLWTGVSPRAHGTAGNNVLLMPRGAHSLLEHRSGFENGELAVPVLWDAVAADGRRALVMQAAGTTPRDGSADRVTQFDIYRTCDSAGLIEGTLPADGQPFTAWIRGTALEFARMPGGVELRVDGERALLSTTPDGRFSPTLTVGEGDGSRQVRVGLLTLDEATGAFTALRGYACAALTNAPDKLAGFRDAAGAILGEGVISYYRSGHFGATLAEGGTGAAEALLAETLEANHAFFEGSLRFAERESWDLLVIYVSTLDAAGHALGGLIDPASPRYTPERAAGAWSVLERVFTGSIDRFVGDVRETFPDATVMVVSDHGMEGTGRRVHPNVALRQAGLLRLGEGGRVDLSTTRVMHLGDHGGAVFVNGADRLQGVVPESELEATRREATRVLLAIRDPVNGSAPIRAVFDTAIDGEALGVGGGTGGELYFDLAPGYDSTAMLTGDQVVTDDVAVGRGDHGGAPWHRRLHGILFVAGPGVDAGRRLGLVRAIDVMPTAARLLDAPLQVPVEGHAYDLGDAP